MATYHANADRFAAASTARVRAKKELQRAMTTKVKANSGLTALLKKAVEANKKRQKTANAVRAAEEALKRAKDEIRADLGRQEAEALLRRTCDDITQNMADCEREFAEQTELVRFRKASLGQRNQ